VLTDPAATARVPATTAQRVLVKNVPTVMACHVMVSHVRSVESVRQQAVVNVPPTATVPHVPTVLTVQDMQTVDREESVLLTETVHSEESVLRMEIVLSKVTDLHMVTAQTGANAPVTAIVVLHLAETVHTVPLVIDPHMVTVETEMHVQNAAASAAVAQVGHLVVSVQVAIVVASHHLVTAIPAQNVLSVLAMVIVPTAENAHRMATVAPDQIGAVTVPPMVIVRNGVIVPAMAIVMVHHVVSVLAMEIAGLVQTVGESVPHTAIVVPVRNAPSVQAMVIVRNVVIVRPMETVDHVQNEVVIAPLMVNDPNDLALEIAAVDQIVPVLPALVAVTSVLAGKSQNLPKNSAWLANFVWFDLITMIPGLMMMSLAMSSTRLHATN
jgi:hypothetical protein